MQVMTDIECYGDDNDRRILQISAVAFDLDGRISDPHELLQTEDCWFDGVIEWDVSDYDNEPANFPANRDTREWWAAAPQAPARELLLKAVAERASTPKAMLYDVVPALLSRFSKFVVARAGKKGGMWALPPTYDLKVLRDLYEYIPAPVPWHYKQERCARTALEMSRRLATVKGPDMETVGLVKHNGLHDAARQAVLVQAAYRSLGLSAGDYARAEREPASVS